MKMLDLSTIGKVESGAEVPDVERRLREAWRRQRRFIFTRGICYLALTACAVAAAAFVLDWRLELSPAGRVMLLLSAAAALLAVGYGRGGGGGARSMPLALPFKSSRCTATPQRAGFARPTSRPDEPPRGRLGRHDPGIELPCRRRVVAVDFGRIIDFHHLRRPSRRMPGGAGNRRHMERLAAGAGRGLRGRG